MFPMNIFSEDDLNDISGIANDQSNVENNTTFEMGLFGKNNNSAQMKPNKEMMGEEI